MKKKLALIISVVVLAALAIGGTTYALFTDDAINKNNTFVAGTVDIDSYRGGADYIPGPMFYTTPEEGASPQDPVNFKGIKPTGLWAPGDMHIRSLVVYNKGSLDAVLNQVKADISGDDSNIAEEMHVTIFKVLPKYLPNGTPFLPLPGDDSLEEEILESTELSVRNWALYADEFIDSLFPRYRSIEELAQAAIEKNLSATPLWDGQLSQLLDGYNGFSQDVFMKATNNQFVERGCLLAFVVQLNKEAGNEHQDADFVVDFTVLAEQARNN